MGKRSDLGEKRPRDYWPTIDPAAVEPLTPFIYGMDYCEPCAGQGHLVMLLRDYAYCLWSSDIEPGRGNMFAIDATQLSETNVEDCDCIITNPPFSWNLLKPLLDHLPTLKPTWLLLPGACIYNKRMGPYMQKCHKIVAVGRLYWMPNKVKGVDDFCWLLFDYNSEVTQTVFYGRT